MKKYILIAGVNGAGKSTLYQTLESLKNMTRINTDEIVRSFGNWQNTSDVFKAGKIAVKKMKEYFDQGITFNQETTLCGASIIQNIKFAKSLGYKIELHYVTWLFYMIIRRALIALQYIKRASFSMWLIIDRVGIMN